MKHLLCALVLALLSAGQLLAGDSPDGQSVCAMAERHYAAVRAGDMDAVIKQHLPEFTFFVNDGGLLWTFRSLEQQRSEFKEVTPDFKSQTYIRHCSARVYGDTGIATYYLVGSVTAQGKTQTGTWRVTEVWVKQGNEWKEAHHHESPLLGSVRTAMPRQEAALSLRRGQDLAAEIQTSNDELLNKGKLEMVPQYFAASYVSHGAGEDTRGREAITGFLTALRDAFPDLRVEIEILATEGDRVAWRRTSHGTHRGAYMGIAASGRELEWQDLVVTRFENGMIVEEWGESGLASLLRAH